jgi:hypothetical protein
MAAEKTSTGPTSTEKKTGFHPTQIFAAALAAVTAALLGSTLGVAGTVLGAAIGSIVSTVAAEMYLRSLERVRSRVVKTSDDKEQKPSRRVRWQLLIGASVAAFVLGMLVITGVEWVRGAPLSGDGKTTIGGVLQAPNAAPYKPAPPQKSTQPSTVTVTPTPTAPPSTPASPPPETSTTGSSTTTSTTTSTTDPAQSDAVSQPTKTP